MQLFFVVKKMKLEEWMKRELDDVYVSTIIMKEQAYKKVGEIPKKQDIYIFMEINLKGYKKFIDVIVPTEDTTSYWYNKISNFKLRGIEELFMVAMVDNIHISKGFKMVYPNMIKMPSMIEFYNNSRPYIIQKDHRKLMSKIQEIYKSETIEEAKELYNQLLEKYKNEKLLIMVINRIIDDIMEVIKYSKEARTITSYTYSYLKMRARLSRLISEYKVFEDNEEIRKYVSEFLKKEEENFKPSKRNWSLIINEMDSIITDKIREKL